MGKLRYQIKIQEVQRSCDADFYPSSFLVFFPSKSTTTTPTTPASIRAECRTKPWPRNRDGDQTGDALLKRASDSREAPTLLLMASCRTSSSIWRGPHLASRQLAISPIFQVSDASPIEACPFESMYRHADARVRVHRVRPECPKRRGLSPVASNSHRHTSIRQHHSFLVPHSSQPSILSLSLDEGTLTMLIAPCVAFRDFGHIQFGRFIAPQEWCLGR